MTRYYIINPIFEHGFEEITKEEWTGLIGEEPNRTFANHLYRSEITINDIPEENRTIVESIVARKVAKWGEYDQQPIPSNELQRMIEEMI